MVGSFGGLVSMILDAGQDASSFDDLFFAPLAPYFLINKKMSCRKDANAPSAHDKINRQRWVDLQ
jgi:hypothetical protein